MSTHPSSKKRLTGPMSRRLRLARIDAGLSRRALSELIGISERAVNYYEDPSYARARKPYIVRAWAEATGRKFEDIWGTTERGIGRTGWLRETAGLAPCA